MYNSVVGARCGYAPRQFAMTDGSQTFLVCCLRFDGFAIRPCQAQAHGSRTKEVFFMQWFKFYPGDFGRDTASLSLAEKGAYMALMSAYYAEEKPLPSKPEKLYRIAGAHTPDEKKAVMSVIDYFYLEDGAYRHKRIDAEISKAAKRAQQNRVNAARRAKNG